MYNIFQFSMMNWNIFINLRFEDIDTMTVFIEFTRLQIQAKCTNHPIHWESTGYWWIRSTTRK